jgi:anti-sigma factor RsiW
MEQSNTLTCQELVELVTDYFEGALSPEDRAQFEAHLAMCHHCRESLEQMRKTIQLVGRLPKESLTSEIRDALLNAFRHWRRTNGR